MTFRERFIRSVSYPLYQRATGLTILSKCRELERLQWRPAETIREYQSARLRSLVADCAGRIPYYRDLFRECGVRPESIRTVDDLAGVPILTKSRLRQNLDAIVRKDGFGRVYGHQSSGSTGEPKVLWTDADCESFRMAALFRSRRWWGWALGAPVLEIWGTYHLQPSLKRGFRMSWIENRSRISLMHFTRESIAEVWKEFLRRKGAYLRGYVSSIYATAKGFEEAGRNASDLGIRAVCTTSERLYTHQRRLIEKVFACPVIDEYGASELGVIAFQCPSGGMHLMEENCIAEFVEPERPGPEGAKRLILTDLNNRATPLIRYEIGDFVRPDPTPCACGSGLRKIQIDIGRDSEIIRLPDGSQMSPVLFCHMGQYSFYEIGKKIRQFRVVQKSLDGFEVDVACRPEDRGDVESYLRRAFQEDFGGLVNLTIRFLDDIPPDASGKQKMFISEIRDPEPI
jgi:phenylacetate-CoA ligase